MVACPSESLKNARNALLEIERAEVESAHLALADDPADHVYRKLDTVVLYLLIIVLYIYEGRAHGMSGASSRNVYTTISDRPG